MPLRRLAHPVGLQWSPSLNPTVLGDLQRLPGRPSGWPAAHQAGWSAGLPGTAARDWLTTWSIARVMAAQPEVVAALTEHRLTVTPLPDVVGVSAALMEAAVSWPPALDALVTADDPRARPVADLLGDALAALTATLSTAPRDARLARPDWTERHWARWRAVRTVVVGGGVVRGLLGAHVVDRAAERLHQLGVDLTLTRAPDAAALGLRGAASLLPGAGVALDCGGTTVKRAWVSPTTAGRRIEPLTVVPAPGRVGAQEVIDRIADAATAVPCPPAAMVLAIATYVDESGQPYAGQLGPYAPLGEIDFREGLTEALRRRVNATVSVRVVHDGTAALLGARIDRPDADAAIVLGTAIGCGLSPDVA